VQDIWRLVVAPSPVLDDVVRRDLITLSAESSRLSSLLGLPLTAVVGGALWAAGAAVEELLVWAGLSLLCMLFYVLIMGLLVIDPDARRSEAERLRVFVAAQAVAGAVWGMLPVAISPAPGDPTVIAVCCAVPILAVAANMVFSAATPGPWLAFHVMILSIASYGMLVHGEPAVAALNGLALVAAAPLARFMYQQMAGARQLARQNELLAGQLRDEREAVERANLELSEANTELRHQATRDPLTGLPNRTLFFDHLVRSMRHGRRGTTPVAVIYLDLDRFKEVNDTLGHGAGDDLLCQVADRVTAVLRGPDVLARMGGDEFVVLTHDYDGSRTAQAPAAVAERVRRVLAAPFDLGGSMVTIGASLGVALDEPDLDAEQLVERADLALYRAKQQGRNRVAVFGDGLNVVQPRADV